MLEAVGLRSRPLVPVLSMSWSGILPTGLSWPSCPTTRASSRASPSAGRTLYWPAVLLVWRSSNNKGLLKCHSFQDSSIYAWEFAKLTYEAALQDVNVTHNPDVRKEAEHILIGSYRTKNTPVLHLNFNWINQLLASGTCGFSCWSIGHWLLLLHYGGDHLSYFCIPIQRTIALLTKPPLCLPKCLACLLTAIN